LADVQELCELDFGSSFFFAMPEVIDLIIEKMLRSSPRAVEHLISVYLVSIPIASPRPIRHGSAFGRPGPARDHRRPSSLSLFSPSC
jgi:ABC-type microcin C transport system permease subunit YejB